LACSSFIFLINTFLTTKQYTPLITATTEEHLDIVKELLKHPSIDVNDCEYESVTALHYACMQRLDDIALELLKRKELDVNARASFGVGDGRIALHWSCFSGSMKIVKAMLQREDIAVNAFSRRCWGTPLQAACEGGQVEVVEELLKRDDVVLRQPNHQVRI